MDKYSYIANAHADYIDELYKSYRQDPNSVDISWQQFFQGFDFSTTYNGNSSEIPLNGTAQTQHSEYSEKEIKVKNLIQGYRFRGHLEAKTNPIRPRKDRQARLSLADFGLSESDLNSKFLVGKEIGLPNATLQEILNQLDKVYKGAIGFEYEYVREPEILDWFKQKVEVEYPKFVPSVDQKLRILSKLNEAATFENFLQTKFIGQKRFSLEGGESTIPALDAIVNKSSELGVEEVVIGMAHRGRLNVLANTMGKTYEHIFNEFQGGGILEEEQGSGDVKYHMGFSSQITTPVGKTVNMKLAPNPSHLEAVNPVVAGYVRAKVDHIYNDFQKALPIIIHGDAAVAGQGIVYEMMQMSALKGYTTGGTIHFVINNQVGFTTDFEDGRSSIYCTDITEIVDSPVLHVNGDNPEAVVFACEIAAEYRQKFGRDIFIDMVCYRRHGHNESDEPKFTQPTLYNLIGKHPNPRDIYAKKLVDQGDISAEVGEKMDKEFRDMLQDRLNFVKQNNLPYKYQKFEKEWKVLRRAKADDFDQSPATNITQDSIDKIAKALTTLPENFEAIKQIQKLIEERKKGFFQDKVLTWAMAELLAYGSLLLEDKIVRLSGQDVERGTFSHRHAIVHHAVTSEPYSMLDNIAPEQEKLHIYNSLLSEYGVLGFEFGYAMANPHALVIWEAQFGDFANGAQIMIDQFISSSESKWQRMTGLVLQLPHGYEGQGPEHSSARPERFLQMCAENNMVVVNVTTPANFFHLLRRQLVWNFRKPCIVMSPKSLLRHPKCVSPLEDFKTGGFKEVIEDNFVDPKKVKRVVLCTGKIYYELLEKQQAEGRKDVAIIRLEQLYPYPKKQLEAAVKSFEKYDLLWVQEEPKNMGYWGYMLRVFSENNDYKINVVSRKATASPATGYSKVHAAEQAEIINKAFDI